VRANSLRALPAGFQYKTDLIDPAQLLGTYCVWARSLVNRERAMSMNSNVYVFVCGWSDLIGLSLDERAANLPPYLASPHKWTLIDRVPLAAHEIGLLKIDPIIAIENLRTRGYHVGKPLPRRVAKIEEVKALY
jgi:hypothetical protein